MLTCPVCSDPRGWPAVDLATSTCWIRCQLWPVTWWQLDELVAEPWVCQPKACVAVTTTRSGPARPALRRLAEPGLVALAVSGLPLGAPTSFAGWLGAGWRLPTDPEWRAIYDGAESAASIDTELILAAARGAMPFVRQVCARIVAAIAMASGGPAAIRLDKLMIMNGDFLEWIDHGPGKRAGRGRQVRTGASHLHWPHDARPVELLTDADRSGVRFRCVTTNVSDFR